METKAKVNGVEDDKTQLVQMRLKPSTLDLLNKLSEFTHTSNRTQLVSASIQLTEEIVNQIQRGNKVYIEEKNGEKSVLKLIGL